MRYCAGWACGVWGAWGAWGAVVGVLALAGLLQGCAAPRKPAANYVFVYLKTGPKSEAKTKEQRAEIFKGHMSNMQRLAEEEKLLIAGPFMKPADTSWRGLFVMNTGDANQARAWVSTDPGVVEGVFVTDVVTMHSSAAIRNAPAAEKQLPKSAESKPGEPPPNLRGYVIVTTADWPRLRSAVGRAAASATPLAGRVVWWGRFESGGVFVFDTNDPSPIAAALAAADAGPFTCDGWYSTVSLTTLGAGGGW